MRLLTLLYIYIYIFLCGFTINYTYIYTYIKTTIKIAIVCTDVTLYDVAHTTFLTLFWSHLRALKNQFSPSFFFLLKNCQTKQDEATFFLYKYLNSLITKVLSPSALCDSTIHFVQ